MKNIAERIAAALTAPPPRYDYVWDIAPEAQPGDRQVPERLRALVVLYLETWFDYNRLRREPDGGFDNIGVTSRREAEATAVRVLIENAIRETPEEGLSIRHHIELRPHFTYTATLT